MLASCHSALSGPGKRAALVALLALLCLLLSAPPVTAADVNETAVGAAAPLGVALGFVNDVVGNRTRMIQVACIFVAIGVFLLTRAIPR